MQVFPGSTPFIETAADEMDVDVNVHEVQKLPALRVVAVLASQAETHPRPSELVEAAAPHLAVLAVASRAAQAMVDSIAPAPTVKPESKPKTTDSNAEKTATSTPAQTESKATATVAVDSESKTKPRK